MIYAPRRFKNVKMIKAHFQYGAITCKKRSFNLFHGSQSFHNLSSSISKVIPTTKSNGTYRNSRNVFSQEVFLNPNFFMKSNWFSSYGGTFAKRSEKKSMAKPPSNITNPPLLINQSIKGLAQKKTCKNSTHIQSRISCKSAYGYETYESDKKKGT